MGSKGGPLRALRTKSRSQLGGLLVATGREIENDLSKSLIIGDDERFGTFHLKISESMDLYPRIQDNDSLLLSCK